MSRADVLWEQEYGDGLRRRYLDDSDHNIMHSLRFEPCDGTRNCPNNYHTESCMHPDNRPELLLEPHPCEHPGCPRIVEYDDEPYCFTHSPDSGSFVPGYSYKETH